MSEAARAPELPEGLDWVNTPHPLRLADLHGRVVMLNFWTGSNINCINALPDLRLLQDKYPQYDAMPLEGRPLIVVTPLRVTSWGALR